MMCIEWWHSQGITVVVFTLWSVYMSYLHSGPDGNGRRESCCVKKSTCFWLRLHQYATAAGQQQLGSSIRCWHYITTRLFDSVITKESKNYHPRQPGSQHTVAVKKQTASPHIDETLRLSHFDIGRPCLQSWNLVSTCNMRGNWSTHIRRAH